MTLKILAVVSEIYPLVKTGGLADVAGALPGAASYRDPVSMRALEQFWDGWFRSSNARLVDFGKPMPTQPVR